MLLPGRHANTSGYRYGFNNMELDNEIKGEGNSYDFGARFYDPRIMRWFAPDNYESKYPSTSTYTYALNSPIGIKDYDGNDIIIIGNKEYRAKVQQVLRDLYHQSPSARETVINLIKSDKVFLIVENNQGENKFVRGNSSKSSGFITFDVNNDNNILEPADGLGDAPLEQPQIISLIHELGHAENEEKGLRSTLISTQVVNRDNPLRRNEDFGTDMTTPEFSTNSISASEVVTVEGENRVRAELGLTLRTHYGGINVFEKKLSDRIYSFGSGNKRYHTPKLLYKPFDKSKYNALKATESFINDIVKKNQWWDNAIDSKEEDAYYFGFGDRYDFPKLDGDDGATRLTIKDGNNGK